MERKLLYVENVMRLIFMKNLYGHAQFVILDITIMGRNIKMKIII